MQANSDRSSCIFIELKRGSKIMQASEFIIRTPGKKCNKKIQAQDFSIPVPVFCRQPVNLNFG
jgi:hypothetical protein